MEEKEEKKKTQQLAWHRMAELDDRHTAETEVYGMYAFRGGGADSRTGCRGAIYVSTTTITTTRQNCTCGGQRTGQMKLGAKERETSLYWTSPIQNKKALAWHGMAEFGG